MQYLVKPVAPESLTKDLKKVYPKNKKVELEN